MKHYYFILLCLWGIGLCSCSSKNSPSKLACEDQSPITAGVKFMYVHDDCEHYVHTHPELFGSNVLIFDSVEQILDELDTLNSMDFTERRYWQHQHSFYNPILTSLIVLDSVQSKVFDRNGITFSDRVSEEEDKYPTNDSLFVQALSEYDAIILRDFTQYLKTTTENGITYCTPLGSIDEQVFANDKGLYICSGIVHKQLTDGMLSCGYLEYDLYANCTSAYQVQNVLVHNPTSNAQVERAETDLVTKNHWTFLCDDYNTSTNYKMKIDFHLYVDKGPLREFRRVVMVATNLHWNSDCKQFLPHLCETKITAHVTTKCSGIGEWTIVPFRTGWCPMGKGFRYSRRKGFKKCGCNGTMFTYIEVDAINQHNCKIKSSKSI